MKPTPSHRSTQFKRVPLLVLGLITLLLAGITIFLLLKNREAQEEIETLKSPERFAQEQLEQNRQVIDSLKIHLLLPEDEDPVLYTITDIEHAQASYGEFFENAQNGDKLILYENQAIVYRFEDERIINMGPVAYMQTDEDSSE